MICTVHEVIYINSILAWLSVSGVELSYQGDGIELTAASEFHWARNPKMPVLCAISAHAKELQTDEIKPEFATTAQLTDDVQV